MCIFFSYVYFPSDIFRWCVLSFDIFRFFVFFFQYFSFVWILRLHMLTNAFLFRIHPLFPPCAISVSHSSLCYYLLLCFLFLYVFFPLYLHFFLNFCFYLLTSSNIITVLFSVSLYLTNFYFRVFGFFISLPCPSSFYLSQHFFYQLHFSLTCTFHFLSRNIFSIIFI